MKRILILLFIVMCTSCAKHAQRDASKKPQTEFGTRIQDTMVKISTDMKTLRGKEIAEGQEFEIQSKDWLGLSGQLMETSDFMGGQDKALFLKLGHDLTREFYDYPQTHTIVTAKSNPPGNPFLEAAAYYARPIMTKKLAESIKGAKAKVETAASMMNIAVGDLPAEPEPAVLLQRIIDGLNNFRANLVATNKGTPDSMVDKISQTIESQYVKDLEEFKMNSKIDKRKPLHGSLQTLGENLKRLNEISEAQKTKLLLDVNWGIDLAKQSKAMTNSHDALAILVDFWLSKNWRKMYPDTLKAVFKGLSSAQIISMATGNQAPIFDDKEWARVKVRTDLTLMPDKELVARLVNNNGYVLGQQEWEALQKNQLRRLNELIHSAEVIRLVNLIGVNEDISTDEERRYVLVNVWLGSCGRISFPSELRSAFEKLTDEELEKLASDHMLNNTTWLLSHGHPVLAWARHQILGALENFQAGSGENLAPGVGIERFRRYFNDRIIAATNARLNSGLWPIAKDLKKVLKEKLNEELDTQLNHSEKIADESFKIYSRYYMGKMVFGAEALVKQSIDDNRENQDNLVIEQHPLPILEKQTVRFVKKDGRIHDLPSEDETTAELTGIGLLTNYFRIRGAGAVEKLPSNSTRALSLDFQNIAKMMALCGYKDDKSKLIESLNVPMTPGHLGELLDIHHYKPDKSLFATPEKIKIKDEFKLDPSSESEAVVSVRGQMELLRGYSHFMHYFKPWQTSGFDNGLGALRIQEDPTLKVFEKSDYYLLSIGLASVILRNLSYKMLGFILDDGSFKESSPSVDVKKLNVTGAVLGDYTVTRMSHVVQTHDLALSIQAISEFYEAMKDVEMSKEPAIVDGFREHSIAETRKDLENLLSGLVLFVTGKLMSSDGGFVVSYDADSKKVSQAERTLEDQLLMERALLSVGHILKSNFIAARAADNFFFLNGHFWNADLGFYKASENAEGVTVKLRHISLAMENALRLKRILPSAMTHGSNFKDSVEQIDRFQKLWVQRFFSPEVLSSPAVVQVQEFSL